MLKRLACGLVGWLWMVSTAGACAPLSLDLQAHAPGIWVRAGRAEDPAGWTEPVVIWVDERQVWVGDPGPHRCAGQALRREIERRWPGRTHHLINSHAHPRNVLANAGWPKGTPIHALAQTRRDMASRCPSCLNGLRQELGEAWMRGTPIVLPNRSLRVGQVLSLAGRRWVVGELTGAHTASDLLLLESGGARWWSPSLVAWSGVPDMGRAGVARWLAALEQLQADPGRAMLGAASGDGAVALLESTRTYLQRLDQTLRLALEQGRSQHEFYGWFEGLGLPQPHEAGLRQHPLNVQTLWRALEEEGLAQQGR